MYSVDNELGESSPKIPFALFFAAERLGYRSMDPASGPFAGSGLPVRFLLGAGVVGMKPEWVPDGRVWEVWDWKGMAKINKRLEV